MKIHTLTLLMLFGITSLTAQQLAFPHAEGYGRFAKGGRGGDVYHVTTLDDYHPKTDQPIVGSLRHAIDSQTGPRTVVFDLSGRIQLKEPIIVKKPYLTIAGQTAPGDGITISDDSFEIKGSDKSVGTGYLHDYIIRFIRFRHGDESGKTGDGITTNYVTDYIFDHISASWTIDGTHDLRGGGNFTMQWSVFGEALNQSTHYKNAAHAMLASYRAIEMNMTLHHNLMLSSRDRHPTLGTGDRADTTAISDFRNNVVYNWRGGTNLGEVRHDFINNYYKPGESTNFGYITYLPLQIKSSRAENAKGYLRGNFFYNAPTTFNNDNYLAVTYTNTGDYNSTTREQFEVFRPFVYGADRPVTQSAQEAYRLVLKYAGASLFRDVVDHRMVKDVEQGTGRLIDSQKEVGGWPVYNSKPALKDSDGDGMPDEWEIKNHLNPNDPSDGNKYTLDKNYTNLEVYLNSLVEHLYEY